MKDDGIIKYIATIEESEVIKLWDILGENLDSLNILTWSKLIYHKDEDNIDVDDAIELAKNIKNEFIKLRKTPYISLLVLCNYDYSSLYDILNEPTKSEERLFWLFSRFIDDIYFEKSITLFQDSINLVIEKYQDSILEKIKNKLKKIPNENVFPSVDDYDFWGNYCVNLQSPSLNAYTYEVESSTIVPTINDVLKKVNPHLLQLLYLYKQKEFIEEYGISSLIEFNCNSKSDNSYLIDSVSLDLLEDVRDMANFDESDITWQG